MTFRCCANVIFIVLWGARPDRAKAGYGWGYTRSKPGQARMI